MAMGYFALMFCDAIFRVRPKVPLTMDNAKREHKLWQQHAPIASLWTSPWLLFKVQFRFTMKVMPLAADDAMDAFDFTAFAFYWGILLLPVPFSRVVLHDHTALQVMVGSLVGTVEAIAWFTFWRKRIQKPYNHLLGTRVYGIFIHNFALPRFEVKSKALRLLADATTDDIDIEEANRRSKSMDGVATTPIGPLVSASARERLGKLTKLKKELRWYILRLERLTTNNVFAEDEVFQQLEMINMTELMEEVEHAVTRIARIRERQTRSSKQFSTGSTFVHDRRRTGATDEEGDCSEGLELREVGVAQ